MSLVIELPPDVERQLNEEAARSGRNAVELAREVLLQRFGRTGARVTGLSPREAELLERINEGASVEAWARYRELRDKRSAEALSPEELQELIAISDSLEEANARRLQHLTELAQLRGVALRELMDQLGIAAPQYE